MSHLALTSLLVRDYDEAIGFFCEKLGFELIEDSPAHAKDGTEKRWVVVRPPGARESGIVLARATVPRQVARIGDQTGGRVAFFLWTDDVRRDHALFQSRGVAFTSAPRDEPYGRVAVFRDVSGNLWDLVGPAD